MLKKQMHLILFMLSFTLISFSQNETSKWYFGNYVGLDFSSLPPVVLGTSTMSTPEGCSSIADGNGNLLFYTNGVNIWNQTHNLMANGTGLLGDVSTVQGALIVKQPNTVSLYYVFTADAFMGPDGLRYSIVDMSLAAGMGSVTTKNIILHTPTSEKLSGVKHCNGSDIWVISHDTNNVFRCYLLSSAGINTTPIISSFPYNGLHHERGSLKVSPDGKKIGLTSIGAPGAIELYDFDNATGAVFNSLTLLNTNSNYCYGCEFSPDGTKFYGTNTNHNLFQWDLCNNSAQSIIASQYTVNNMTISKATMQLALDGKIYITRPNQAFMGIINNPNASGNSCGYVDQGLAISSGTLAWGLPNFVSSYFYKKQPFVAVSQNCSTSFSAQACLGSSLINSVSWNFGDPQSFSSNTSSLSNPVHVFSSPGTYIVKLIRNYNCYSDTIQQNVIITYLTPSLIVTGKTISCVGEQVVLIASGCDTYTWSSAAIGPSISVTPTLAGNITFTVSGTNTLVGCSSTKAYVLSVSDCLQTEEEVSRVVKFFPNPTTGILTVVTDEFFDVEVYDQFGINILKKQFNPSETKIDFQKFTDGVYFLKVIINKKLVNYIRIVKIAGT